MMRASAVVIAILALTCAAFAYETCKDMPRPVDWAASWQQVAFVAIMMGYLIVGVIYMVGLGFNSPMLVASARKDMMYLVFITALAGTVLVVDNLVNNNILPAFRDISFIDPANPRPVVAFCSFSSGAFMAWDDLQQHTVEYSVCLREKTVAYFRTLMEMNFLFGFISSISLIMQPLGIIGLGFNPGAGMRPFIDTMGYGLYVLAITIAQMKVQEVFLCFSRNYALTVFFPLGIALSAISLTRSAGGALISLAIGLSLVLPITYLASEEIVQDYCSLHGDCKFGSLDVMTSVLGNARDVSQSMFDSKGEKAAQFVSLLSLDGPLGPMIYLIAIAGTLLPLCSLIITLLFVKSLSTIFGAEVDFSALIKLL